MAKGLSSLKDKIRMLLEVARSAGSSAEGQSARALAERKMKAAGLTEADVVADKKVALGGRVATWEQALMEVCAESAGLGLEVDRELGEWTLSGPASSVEATVIRFHGIRDQLIDASLEYMGDVRRGMREVNDDPTTARAVLERIRRVFLEAGTLSVYMRLLQILLESEFGDEEPSRDKADHSAFEMPDEAPSRDKKPFDKLMDRLSMAEDFDWDLEIEVADWVKDPTIAGEETGASLALDAPFPVSHRRLPDGRWSKAVGQGRRLRGSSGPQLEDRGPAVTFDTLRPKEGA